MAVIVVGTYAFQKELNRWNFDEFKIIFDLCFDGEGLFDVYKHLGCCFMNCDVLNS